MAQVYRVPPEGVAYDPLMSAVTDHEKQRMRRAVALARKGRFHVEPNPPVGCIVEGTDGAGIVGEGWHKAYGGPHAEIEALAVAGERARGATVYVTLEPCAFEGKTGPCAEALVTAGVARVFFGTQDPNPRVAGKGLARLEAAGIEVVGPVEEAAARELLRHFEPLLTRRTPWVIAKWAMSLDGSIAPARGVGGAISGRKVKLLTHDLRGRVEAVLVGGETLRVDDADLRCRLADGPPAGRSQPLRVILTRTFDVAEDARLLGTASEDAPVLIVGCNDAAPPPHLQGAGIEATALPRVGEQGVELRALFELLHERGVRRVLLEGGSALHGAALRAGLVDQVRAIVVPTLLGGSDAVPAVRGTGIDRVGDALALEDIQWRRVEDDLLVDGYVPRPAS